MSKLLESSLDTTRRGRGCWWASLRSQLLDMDNLLFDNQHHQPKWNESQRIVFSLWRKHHETLQVCSKDKWKCTDACYICGSNPTQYSGIGWSSFASYAIKMLVLHVIIKTWGKNLRQVRKVYSGPISPGKSFVFNLPPQTPLCDNHGTIIKTTQITNGCKSKLGWYVIRKHYWALFLRDLLTQGPGSTASQAWLPCLGDKKYAG